MMAVSAVRSLPDNVKWLAASARAGAARTGQVFAMTLLDDYRETLREIRETGYATYGVQQLSPYVRAAARQFSPASRTLTERLLDNLDARRAANRDRG